jgi:diguanylate cyclase (GGDEF)-like protein
MSTDTSLIANPKTLLREIHLLVAVSILVVLLLAGTGIHRIISDEMMRAAEGTAVHVANSLYEMEREILLKSTTTSQSSVALDAKDIPALDDRMRRFLRTFHMYKIKIYDKSNRIIYSTDPTIIGTLDAENHKLKRVLNHAVAISDLTQKPVMRDLNGFDRYDVDVVESYVPILDAGNVMGAFEVYIDTTEVQEQIYVTIRNALGVLVAVLLMIFGLLLLPIRKGMRELIHAQDMLHSMASTDVLTGICNRRYVMERLSIERSRLRRGASGTALNLTVAMVDIDHFKKINDKYGHPAGDAILREIADRLRGSLRTYDTLGRYGGEEFLAVLPSASQNDGMVVASRMLEAVRATPVTWNGEAISVTVSIGVAALRTDEDPAHTISRADEALYAAKNAGRNRIHASMDDAPLRLVVG